MFAPRTRGMVAVVVAAVAVALSVAVADAQAGPVSPATLQKCLNQHGGYIDDKAMVGSPCAPFKNRPRVLAFVKDLLVYNGYRPSMTVTNLWARQIGLSAIRDGIPDDFLVVKSGRHQIALVHWTEYGYPVVNRFSVPFDT